VWHAHNRCASWGRVEMRALSVALPGARAWSHAQPMLGWRYVSNKPWRRPPQTKGATLAKACERLPSFGVGSKLYRSTWKANGYDPETHNYTVTSVSIAKNTAMGVRCWKGMTDSEATPVKGADKPEWRVLQQ